jgi:hypothetical protein
MAKQDLPPDLDALEQELYAHARPGPEPTLRSRVLAAVRRELDQDERRPAWRFAVATAAAVLLWINFSMSISNDMNWPLVGGLDEERLESSAARIRALDPELSEREARRQALVAQAHFRSAPGPSLGGDPNRILRGKERRKWDTY